MKAILQSLVSSELLAKGKNSSDSEGAGAAAGSATAACAAAASAAATSAAASSAAGAAAAGASLQKATDPSTPKKRILWKRNSDSHGWLPELRCSVQFGRSLQLASEEFVCKLAKAKAKGKAKAKAKGKAACKRPAAERTSCWLESKSFGLVKKTVAKEKAYVVHKATKQDKEKSLAGLGQASALHLPGAQYHQAERARQEG